MRAQEDELQQYEGTCVSNILSYYFLIHFFKKPDQHHRIKEIREAIGKIHATSLFLASAMQWAWAIFGGFHCFALSTEAAVFW